MSMRAKDAANRFIAAIKSGKIKRDVLPDHGEPCDEKKEYEKFCKFANTGLYKRLIERW